MNVAKYPHRMCNMLVAPSGDRIPQALSFFRLSSIIHASNSGVFTDINPFAAYTKVETSIAPSRSWLPNDSPVSVAWLHDSFDALPY